MIGRIQEWRGTYGFVIRKDETTGQLVRYFLPGGQIKFLAVDEPEVWNWVSFIPGSAPKYPLSGGRAANPIAQSAGIYASREEVESADSLIAVGASTPGGR